jgi:hypothetical protein
MTTAPTTPDPEPPTPAGVDAPSRSARLLGLVRKLIDYGKELAATIRRRAFTDPQFASTHFGSADAALILASISRGLHRANALEARIVRSAARLDAAPHAAASPRNPRPPRPAAAPAAAEADPRLARLPTPAQIAAEVRRRPIGAVLADICRDLGIMPSDPLWRELQLAIICEGGNLCRLVMDVVDRAMAPVLAAWPPGMVLTWPDPPPRLPPPPGTGPP